MQDESMDTSFVMEGPSKPCRRITWTWRKRRETPGIERGRPNPTAKRRKEAAGDAWEERGGA